MMENASNSAPTAVPMFDAFGDESCGADYISYALVILDERKRSDAEKIVGDVKVAAGFDSNDLLHCREIFNPAARAKGAWSRLSVNDVFQLYENLFTRLSPVTPRYLLTLARRADFPTQLPALAMQHIDPNANVPPKYTNALEYGEKQIALHCAQGATIPLSKHPGLDRIRIWPDPDNSKIEWFSGRRGAANEIGNFFVDVGPGQEPPKPTIMRCTGPKPPLLQVADAVAFVGQRSKRNDKSPNAVRFRSLLRLINPEQIIYGVAPDGGFGFNIPNTTLASSGRS
jgi:hypothetical protein